MRYVDPARWPLALALYAAAGIAIGLAATPLQSLAGSRFGKPGLGMFVAINLLLPIASVLVTSWYPRIRTALLGGLIVGTLFIILRLMHWDWRLWNWTPRFVLAHTHPIGVAAAIGCAALGPITALAINPVRRVGTSDHASRCPECSYLLHGLESPLCPECGADLVGHPLPRG